MALIQFRQHGLKIPASCRDEEHLGGESNRDFPQYFL